MDIDAASLEKLRSCRYILCGGELKSIAGPSGKKLQRTFRPTSVRSPSRNEISLISGYMETGFKKVRRTAITFCTGAAIITAALFAAVFPQPDTIKKIFASTLVFLYIVLLASAVFTIRREKNKLSRYRSGAFAVADGFCAGYAGPFVQGTDLVPGEKFLLFAAGDGLYCSAFSVRTASAEEGSPLIMSILWDETGKMEQTVFTADSF